MEALGGGQMSVSENDNWEVLWQRVVRRVSSEGRSYAGEGVGQSGAA